MKIKRIAQFTAGAMVVAGAIFAVSGPARLRPFAAPASSSESSSGSTRASSWLRLPWSKPPKKKPVNPFANPQFAMAITMLLTDTTTTTTAPAPAQAISGGGGGCDTTDCTVGGGGGSGGGGTGGGGTGGTTPTPPPPPVTIPSTFLLLNGACHISSACAAGESECYAPPACCKDSDCTGANAQAACINHACSYQCFAGYQDCGGSCIPLTACCATGN